MTVSLWAFDLHGFMKPVRPQDRSRPFRRRQVKTLNHSAAVMHTLDLCIVPAPAIRGRRGHRNSQPSLQQKTKSCIDDGLKVGSYDAHCLVHKTR